MGSEILSFYPVFTGQRLRSPLLSYQWQNGKRAARVCLLPQFLSSVRKNNFRAISLCKELEVIL